MDDLEILTAINVSFFLHNLWSSKIFNIQYLLFLAYSEEFFIFFFKKAVSRPKSRVINDLDMGEQVVICTLLECQQMAMKQRLAQILPVTNNQFCVTALGNTK